MKKPSTARDLRGFDYKAYLLTDVWQARRQWKLDAADHRCQLCNSDDRLQVHHRTYERVGNEREYDLIVLCDDCHKHHHRIPDEPSTGEYTKPVSGIIPNPGRWGEHATRAAEIAREITIASNDPVAQIALLEEKRLLAVRRRAETRTVEPA